MDNNLAQKLKLIRKIRCYSIDQIANYLGVSPNTLQRYETGKTEPDAEFIARFATFFHVSADDLFSDVPAEHIRLVTGGSSIEEDKFRAAADEYINSLFE